MKTKIVLFGILLLSHLGFGQIGVSSGSMSLLQSNGLNSTNASGSLNERMVIVEDFFNYHKHQLALPERGEIALHMDYNNDLLEDEGSFLLQIGLTTQVKENLSKSAKGVNVSLVIDRSGSMSANNRMEKVKEAVKTFVNGLEDDSYLSIISFSGSANIDLAATRVGSNRNVINTIIENIYPSGYTNISDGLKLGYQELLKNHSSKLNSRLLLLTDGMTNRGETNPKNIIQNSKSYNDKGIEISTIGVGQSLDFDLLRNLAETGRGSNHFIGDNETDIQKVFVDELESLLYQIGKNPKLKITLPEGYTISKFYGYSPNHISGNEISVSLENLNSGITQILLMEVIADRKNSGNIKTELTFTKNGKQEILSKEFKYHKRVKSTNSEIVKNYSIAFMADALKEYAKQYISNRNADTHLLTNALSFTDMNIPNKDSDVKRVYDILKGIENTNSSHSISGRP